MLTKQKNFNFYESLKPLVHHLPLCAQIFRYFFLCIFQLCQFFSVIPYVVFACYFIQLFSLKLVAVPFLLVLIYKLYYYIIILRLNSDRTLGFEAQKKIKIKKLLRNNLRLNFCKYGPVSWKYFTIFMKNIFKLIFYLKLKKKNKGNFVIDVYYFPASPTYPHFHFFQSCGIASVTSEIS